MTNVFQKLKLFVLAGALGVLALASSSSSAETVTIYGRTFTDTSLPALVDPSLPAFGTPINATYTDGFFNRNKRLQLTATNPTSTFRVPGSPFLYGITNTTYDLTAYFNLFGQFISGTVAITGNFNGSPTSETLMTADLIAFSKNASGRMWGFNTDNIVCSSAINLAANGCTTAEAVYIALNKGHGLFSSWTERGIALTSVPVPAAAWLFGAGLAGLVGIARRKRMS